MNYTVSGLLAVIGLLFLLLIVLVVKRRNKKSDSHSTAMGHTPPSVPPITPKPPYPGPTPRPGPVPTPRPGPAPTPRPAPGPGPNPRPVVPPGPPLNSLYAFRGSVPACCPFCDGEIAPASRACSICGQTFRS